MTEPDPITFTADLLSRSPLQLATLFYPGLGELGQFEAVAAETLPADARLLLAHHDHMTVALEAFHDSPVVVTAHREFRDEATYGRVSTLSRQTDGGIVQFGIIRIWLADLPAAAQDGVLNRRAPLGRVLIEQDVLRQIELLALWRIMPGPVLRHFLNVRGDEPVYGRTAQILVDARPTVQLLEIVKLV